MCIEHTEQTVHTDQPEHDTYYGMVPHSFNTTWFGIKVQDSFVIVCTAPGGRPNVQTGFANFVYN